MVKKKIVCIVQARLASQRLHGKILKKINKKYNVIKFLVCRLKLSKIINNILVAYPNKKKDIKIEKKLNGTKILFFRGSEKNVLSRYFKAAIFSKADVIVRITSDCPFADPKLIDKFIKYFLSHNYDYVSNTFERTYPDGFDIEVFNFKTLKFAYKNAYSSYDKEHVTPFIINSKKMKKKALLLKKNYSKFRITLDNKDDLNIMQKIAKNLNPNKYFSWRYILKKMNNLKN